MPATLKSEHDLVQEKERLIADIQQLLTDAQGILTDASEHADDHVSRLRAKLSDHVDKVKDSLYFGQTAHAQKSARSGRRDRRICPRQSVAIGRCRRRSRLFARFAGIPPLTSRRHIHVITSQAWLCISLMPHLHRH